MKKSFSILIIALITFACINGDEDLKVGTQLLTNTDFSRSDSSVSPWSSITPRGFSTGVSRDNFRSGNQSIFIESTDSLSTESAIWKQSYAGVMPGPGQRLRLRAFIKGDNITSNGSVSNVFISIRAFPVEDSGGTTIGRFASTQNLISVNGTFDWEPLVVALPNVPSEIDHIIVYLVMSQRTFGKVYFDDVTLTVE